MDPPCVARENCETGSLWSRTNVSGLVLELMLRAIMEIRARPSSLPAMPRRAIWGHQFSDVLERPFVHLLFSLADLGGRPTGRLHRISPCCERLIGDCSRRLRYAA